MKKILVVESNDPIEGLSSALFRRRECVLDVASSGAEALTSADKATPDLVLYDALVTDFSPEDFVQALHSSAGGEDTPVLVLLQQGEAAREKTILQAGANAVLFRPTRDVDLNAKVCELLGISLRRHVRTFVKMKVDATVGATTAFATISDISLGGVMIETDHPITVGEIIKLSFFLPNDDDAITVISKVVREVPKEDGQGYGCQFMDLTDSSRKRIHDFVTAAEGDE